MSITENLKNTFGELVEAYDDADDDAKEPLATRLISHSSSRISALEPGAYGSIFLIKLSGQVQELHFQRRTRFEDSQETNDVIWDQACGQACNRPSTLVMRSQPKAHACPIPACHLSSDRQL